METQTWRQRHLPTVTAELEDLVVNLQQPGSCCQACMIRLLQEGIELMKTGRLTFPRPEKELLLQIRKGDWSREAVELYFAELEAELRATELISPLPRNIDRAKVSSIISNAYIAQWRSQGLL